jgi:mannose-6-phosphate isomerase
VLLVRGVVKDYDWGIVDGLVPWTGEPTSGPQAELWFGVHPGGPSPVVDPSGQPTGEHLGAHFDVEHIPILVKLLAAARPLSVQVHPDAGTAARMWADQEAGRAPVTLTDPFEKTEMIVALEPFEALVGWRAADSARAILAAMPGCSAAAEAAGEPQAALRALLALEDPAAATAALPAAARNAGLSDEAVSAYATIADLYPDDPGAPVTALLDHVVLAPGEAAYVPAGVPHSYVRGLGLEVMTSSDNVLRLGLTSKAVFVEEALGCLVDTRQPALLRQGYDTVIAPSGAPFTACVITGGSTQAPTGTYRIVLLIDGSASVRTSLADVDLHVGAAAVFAADDPDLTVVADGRVALLQAAAQPRGARG